MTSPAAQPIDTENQRQQRLAEMTAEEGPQWLEQYKPGSFGCHELLDRSLLVGDMVEQYILSHPACVQDPHWYALAEQAMTVLRELYQRVGEQHLTAKEHPERTA
jgi:hypothetical protein